MLSAVLLDVRTTRHRYVVQRDQLAGIRLLDRTHLPLDEHGRSYIGVELGPLLDAQDHSLLPRRRALLVPLRRRMIALMVDYVEALQEGVRSCPLPPLLVERLRQPWAIAAMVIGSDVVLQLDLRAVARSALADLNRSPEYSRCDTSI